MLISDQYVGNTRQDVLHISPSYSVDHFRSPALSELPLSFGL